MMVSRGHRPVCARTYRTISGVPWSNLPLKPLVETMKSPEIEVLQGTLDMFILKAVSFAPRHGYSILEWLRQTTRRELRIEDAALYPALHRLEAKGFIEAEWGLSENNRRAKYYRLTESGRRRLREYDANWRRYVTLAMRILDSTSPATA